MGGFVHYRNLPDARCADNLLVEAPPHSEQVVWGPI